MGLFLVLKRNYRSRWNLDKEGRQGRVNFLSHPPSNLYERVRVLSDFDWNKFVHFIHSRLF